MPAAPDTRSRDPLSTRSAFSREIPPALQRLRCAPLAIALSSCLATTAVQAEHAQSPDGPTLETVEVHGERLRTDLLREQALTPGGVTLIDIETLFQRNVSNMADLLRFTPGVWSASPNGGSPVFLSSRGSNLDATDFDVNGIKLLQDGLPVTTADGNNHNRLIDPLSMRYATVARGANAMTFGASTLGGAINFVSPTALNTAPLQLYTMGGSHGRLNAQATAARVFDNGLDGLLTVASDNWDGYRDHSKDNSNSVYGNTGWQFGDGNESRLYAAYIDTDMDLPGTLSKEQINEDPDQASTAALGGDYGKKLESWRVANKTRWVLGDNSAVELGFSWEEQSLYHPIVDKVLVDFDGPGPMPPQEVFSLLIDTDHRDAGMMARYELTLGEHNVLVGINAGDGKVTGGNYRNDNGQKNGLTTKVDNKASNVEAFAIDRWQFAPQWTFVYGAQAVWADREIENVEVASGEVRDPQGNYDSINPRIGVLYDISDNITLFANVSKVFEPPTNFELEDDVRANQDTLDAMKGYVVETGSRGLHSLGQASEMHWEVSVYHGWIDNEILSVDDPLAPGTSLSTNVDNTIHAGVEALWGASIVLDNVGQHTLAPTLSFTLNEFNFDNDDLYGNNQLPAAPGYALRGELLYRNAGGFFVGPTFDVIDDRYADFANTYKVDDYQLLGLRGGYTAERWEVFAQVDNLLDTEYVSALSVRDIALPDAEILSPGAPLSFYAGFRYQL
jgi:iron complex outermembrane receptor protein